MEVAERPVSVGEPPVQPAAATSTASQSATPRRMDPLPTPNGSAAYGSVMSGVVVGASAMSTTSVASVSRCTTRLRPVRLAV